VIKTTEETERTVYNIEVGGPIIKDKLFFYGLYQGEDEKFTQFFEGGSSKYDSSSPQYLIKLDWNITDRNLLELTYWQDEKTTDGVFFQRPTAELLDWGGGDEIGTSKVVRGGENMIARWTGYLTDSFTLSALYGDGKYSRGTSDSNSENCKIIIDLRSERAGLPSPTAPLGVQGCWVSTFKANPNAGDERKSYRLDAEWAIGDHTLRAGYDYEEFETVDANIYSGSGYWRYVNTTPGATLPGNGGVVPAGVYEVVRFRYFENGGTFLTKNSAYYLEDTWNVTDNFLVYAGVRNEGFENLNSAGGTFIDVQDTWAPRLGFSWDIEGDSSKKLFANAGRYYIPVYSNTNVRLSGAETDWNEWYTFTSIDPATGNPGGTTQLGTRYYTSNGVLPDPRTVVDAGLSPMYQDELILGYQQQLNENWTAGVRAIYRDLKSGMDDICNFYEPYYWALDNGYSEDDAYAIAAAINHCFLTNPGETLKAYVDFGGDDLELVTIPPEGLGLPKAKREYKAIELLLEGTWDNAFLQASYTWSESKGNTEGYVKSDNGQDDAGITQDFDYPGLMEGAYGYLPNDRRHTFKVFGSYSFTDEWSVGGNMIAQSGRPRNCFGVYPADGPGGGSNYGVASFHCGTGAPDAEWPNQLHPRGTSGRVPWVFLADAQVVYTPVWAEGLTLRMAVNNIFDSKDYYRQNDNYEDVGREPTYYYGYPQSIVTPRNVSFQVGYKF
jgi:hypothetical protein